MGFRLEAYKKHKREVPKFVKQEEEEEKLVLPSLSGQQDEVQSLVIDNSSGMIKAGFGGDDGILIGVVTGQRRVPCFLASWGGAGTRG